MRKFISRSNFVSTSLSIVLSFVFVASVVFASTTISSNIQTDGTLAVTGVSTFTGQLQASSTALFGSSVTAYTGLTVGSATVANALDGTILLKAQTSDPAGVTQGTFYYNSTSKVLKMYDGTSWFTVGTTTSGISLTGGRLQLGDLTTQYLTLGTTTQQASGQALVTLEATTTTSIPLVLVGYNGQTGNLFSIRNAGSTKLLYVNSAGGIFGSSTLQVTGAVINYGNATSSSNLYVGSTLTVSGNATTTSAGAISAQGNLTVVGLTSMSNATSSSLYASGTFTVGGNATTTSAGALSIQGKFGVGTSTAPTSEISADGVATTTIAAFSSTSLVGGCIQLKGTNGTTYRMYVANGEPATTTPSGKVGFLAVWEVGSCK